MFQARERQRHVTIDAYERIHHELTRIGVTLAATLPDDWVGPLIGRIDADPAIRHVPVGREAEAVVVATGAFFAGVKSVAVMGTTGLLMCTGELATLNLRYKIPVFCIVSMRGSYDDHKTWQEVQGRRTIPVLQAYDFPYHVINTLDECGSIPAAFEASRLQKRPYILFLTRELLKGRIWK
jgi:sulfopyruvate decarboxylase subunit alpha